MMHRPLALIALLTAPAYAQIPGFDAKPPVPLPGPPMLAHYLLESPTLPFALLIALGVISYLVLQSRKPRRARQLAGSFAALAIVLVAVGELVQTPREKGIAVTKQLVHAVASGDTRSIDAALAPTAALYSESQPQGQPKSVIVDRAGSYFGPGGQYKLDDHAILEAQGFLANPSLVQVQVKVRTTIHETGVPIMSWWRLDLIPAPGGAWEVNGIRFLSSSVSVPGLSSGSL